MPGKVNLFLPDYSSDAGFYFEEIKEVLLVMAYGMALTFSYDLLRIIRRIIKHCNVAVSVEDIIFWLFVSYTTLVFIIKIDDGGLRVYFSLVLYAAPYYIKQ